MAGVGSRKRKLKSTSDPTAAKVVNNRWLARDKVKLLEGIKKYGLDVDRLEVEIGTKTKEDIVWQLKARVTEGIKSFRNIARDKTAPIEIWQKRAVKNAFYYPDYSKALKTIFMNAANGSQYAGIYKLLCDLIDGKPPADCSREDSLTLLKLIEDLAGVIKCLNLTLVTKMICEDGIGLEKTARSEEQSDDGQDESRSATDIILNPLNVPKLLLDRVWSQAAKVLDIGKSQLLVENEDSFDDDDDDDDDDAEKRDLVGFGCLRPSTGH